jgi:hypothetical protein
MGRKKTPALKGHHESARMWSAAPRQDKFRAPAGSYVDSLLPKITPLPAECLAGP